jgi:hypothetical protein
MAAAAYAVDEHCLLPILPRATACSLNKAVTSKRLAYLAASYPSVLTAKPCARNKQALCDRWGCVQVGLCVGGAVCRWGWV